MTALSADTVRQQYGAGSLPDTLPVLMKTGQTFYNGSLVCTDSTGYGVVGSTATGLKPIGVYMLTSVANAGASGAVSATVKPGIFEFANSSAADEITQSEIGSDCYIVDDNTVAKTDGTGTRSRAGQVISLAPSGGVFVVVGPYPIPGATYVTTTGVQTLTNKTLTSPTINSPTITAPTIGAAAWAAATHAHEAAASGGQLDGTACFGTGVDVANGGTGLTTVAAGDTLYASASDTLSALTKGTARQMLRMNAGATAPEWGAVGMVSANAPAFVAGDCAITPNPGTMYIIQATATNSTVTITTTNLSAGDIIGFSADGTNNGHTVTYVDGVTTISSAKTASKRHAVAMFFDGTNLTVIGEISP